MLILYVLNIFNKHLFPVYLSHLFLHIIDACQYGYIPYVVREAVGDRHNSIHESNLFDLQAKYAEVSTKNKIIEELKKLYLGTSVKDKLTLTHCGDVDEEEVNVIDESTFQIEEITITKMLKESESGEISSDNNAVKAD